jgi:hypothetical protein
MMPSRSSQRLLIGKQDHRAAAEGFAAAHNLKNVPFVAKKSRKIGEFSRVAYLFTPKYGTIAVDAFQQAGQRLSFFEYLRENYLGIPQASGPGYR